jgi:RluA family pseudouridine synthase
MKNAPPFTVIYEDDRIIAVNKVAGLSVGGDRWDDSKERLDRLLFERNSAQVPIFTVHRIDRDTSGLVVFAKDGKTHRFLSRAFESRSVKKEYLAVVHGRPPWEEAECDLPLVIDGDKRHRTIVDRFRGKKSLTRFKRILCAGNYSIIEARPETGRSHQIRVHLAALGYAIVCDPLYGKSERSSALPGGAEKGLFLSSFKRSWRGDSSRERPLIERLALHAARLVLPLWEESADIDRDDSNNLELTAPLPRDFRALENQMKKFQSGGVSGEGEDAAAVVLTGGGETAYV